MNNIQKVFENTPGYIGYLTAGDGGHAYSLRALLALQAGGVNILEVGVPFTDPVADGEVIQKAMQRSLQSGTTLLNTLALVENFRQKSDTPVILFSYYNPIYTFGKGDFFSIAKESGVDGILVVDLPFEEASDFIVDCKKNDLQPIFVISPSTPLERIKQFDELSEAFLYYACRKGTTGVQNTLPEDALEKLKEIKENVSQPVVAGFGISTPEQVRSILSCADGFVVGSYFVNQIASGKTLEQLTQSANYLIGGSL
jgi:tryptophan synthase alpha chain